LQTIYVVDNLGEKMDVSGQGQAHPLSALTRVNVPDITFVHARLCDPEKGRHVVLHEVGHLVDGEEKHRVSLLQTDADGQILFGHGHPVTDPNQTFDLGHDEFVSHYASLAPKEDFAEIHAVVLKQRTAYNLANPGRDLLTEPTQVASAWLS